MLNTTLRANTNRRHDVISPGACQPFLCHCRCHYTDSAPIGLFATSCVILWRVNHIMMRALRGSQACSVGLDPCAPHLNMFCAECFGRPVSQEVARRRLDSCVGHGLRRPSHVVLMDHHGCNDTHNLLSGPELARRSAGGGPLTSRTGVVVPNATADSHQRGRVDRTSEGDLSRKKNKGRK